MNLLILIPFIAIFGVCLTGLMLARKTVASQPAPPLIEIDACLNAPLTTVPLSRGLSGYRFPSPKERPTVFHDIIANFAFTEKIALQKWDLPFTREKISGHISWMQWRTITPDPNRNLGPTVI